MSAPRAELSASRDDQSWQFAGRVPDQRGDHKATMKPDLKALVPLVWLNISRHQFYALHKDYDLLTPARRLIFFLNPRDTFKNR